MEGVFLTGATGFLGLYITESLLQKGYEVHGYGRNHPSEALQNHHRFHFHRGDLRDKNALKEASRNCSYCIHGGALSSVWGEKKDFFEINVEGSRNVLEACRINGIKTLVFISSPSIYSGRGDHLNLKEDFQNPQKPLNHYIWSKMEAERWVLNRKKEPFQRIILRPRALFGIGDSSIIPRLLRAGEKVGIPLFRGGDQLMDITPVENVADAAVLAMESRVLDRSIFNISNGTPLKYKELLETLFTAIEMKPRFLRLPFFLLYGFSFLLEGIYRIFNLKGEPVFTRYTLITLAYSQSLNIDKAREKLSYKPKISVKQGLEKYAEWYKTHH